MVIEIGTELADTIKWVFGFPLLIFTVLVLVPWGWCAISKKYGEKK